MDRVTALKQEIFNEVFTKASKQNFTQSFQADAWEICAYRGTDGRCCNVGFLIPDDRYDVEFEGWDVDHSPVFEATTAFDRCRERGFNAWEIDIIRDFLSELQMAHDDASSDNEHCRRLKLLAEDRLLEVPVLEGAR